MRFLRGLRRLSPKSRDNKAACGDNREEMRMPDQFPQDVLEGLKRDYKDHPVVPGLISALEASRAQAECFREYLMRLEVKYFRSTFAPTPWVEFRKMIKDAPDITKRDQC